MTEWSGYDATSVEQLVAAAHASGSALSPGSFTTSNPDDLILSEIYTTLSTITDPQEPWNALTGVGIGPSSAGVYQSVTSARLFNPAFTLKSSTNAAAAGMAAFVSGPSRINETGAWWQQGGDTGTATIVIPKPYTGVVSGAVLIAQIWGYTGDTPGNTFAATFTPPRGWTEINDTLAAASGPKYAEQEDYGTYYRVSDGTDGSSYTWTGHMAGCTNGNNCNIEFFGSIEAYSGVNTSHPIDTSQSKPTLGLVGTTPSLSAITTTRPYDLIIALFADDDFPHTFTPPSGFFLPAENTLDGNYISSQLNQGGSGCCNLAVFEKLQVSAGSTGVVNSTVSGDSWYGTLLALEPAR